MALRIPGGFRQRVGLSIPGMEVSVTLPVARKEHDERAMVHADFVRMDDDGLITLFQSGEERAFRTLVERYEERIHNLLRGMFHDTAAVDDLVQEIFIKVYEALPRFRFESSFYTWLYRIAVNRSRDEIRRRKVRRFLSFQSLDDGTEHEIDARLATPPENRDDQEIIHLGLHLLPEKFRTAVVLKDLEGMSYEEIAEIMQCEIGTVKSRLSRGRTMLRKALQPLVKEAEYGTH